MYQKKTFVVGAIFGYKKYTYMGDSFLWGLVKFCFRLNVY